MAKKKYYVVWVGRQVGIFETWEECKEQTDGFPAAVYKSFPSRNAAELAFSKESSDYIRKRSVVTNKLSKEELQLIGKPIEDSIAVDGAWNTTSGLVEYQGIYNKTYETCLVLK